MQENDRNVYVFLLFLIIVMGMLLLLVEIGSTIPKA